MCCDMHILCKNAKNGKLCKKLQKIDNYDFFQKYAILYLIDITHKSEIAFWMRPIAPVSIRHRISCLWPAPDHPGLRF